MSAFLTGSLLIISLPLLVSADHFITAEPGDTITLPCRAPDNRPIEVVDWDRTDLQSDYVLLFRGNQLDPEGQHASFQNRVDLQDRQLKDGDVSLVLNNVMMEDSGIYECRVDFSKPKQGRKPSLFTDPLNTVYLQVVSPEAVEGRERHEGHQGGTSAGDLGLIVGLVVLAVIVLMIPAVVVIIVRRKMTAHPPPYNEEEKPALPQLQNQQRTEQRSAPQLQHVPLLL